MDQVSFADVALQSVHFNPDDPAEKLVLELIDSSWVQRLRDISQTANTRLVYMFSEHSRFGHCLGAAFLACDVVNKLAQKYPKKVNDLKAAVCAAALLHDIGHLAPGSHIAQKAWFPKKGDCHEQIAIRIIREDQELQDILKGYSKELPEVVCHILSESPYVPSWTWELISGGGWNVDRGNWCIVDSVMGGVSYGKYNIHALTDAIVLTDDDHLALNENRLDAMVHFVVSRHAMYQQMYQHRVLLAADTISKALIKRARNISLESFFADQWMQATLAAESAEDLSLETIFWMRESWWRYHCSEWTRAKDAVIADLADRHLHRKLFKTVRIREDDNPSDLLDQASKVVKDLGYDPDYYLHQVSTMDVHAGDVAHSMLTQLANGEVKPMLHSNPLFEAITNSQEVDKKNWLVMPTEAKSRLNRSR